VTRGEPGQSGAATARFETSADVIVIAAAHAPLPSVTGLPTGLT
jgi:hypothetical protein